MRVRSFFIVLVVAGAAAGVTGQRPAHPGARVAANEGASEPSVLPSADDHDDSLDPESHDQDADDDASDERVGWSLPPAAVKELLASGRVLRDDALAATLGDWFDVYRVDDGTVLLVLGDGAGTMWPSREKLLASHAAGERKGARGPHDPVGDFFPDADAFVRDVARHAAKLTELVGVDGPLDGSMESIARVEREVRALPRARRRSPEVVVPLVAYVGESMRRVVDGEWTVMAPRDSTEAARPIVVDRSGRICDPVSAVLRGAIAASFAVEVGDRLPRRP